MGSGGTSLHHVRADGTGALWFEFDADSSIDEHADSDLEPWVFSSPYLQMIGEIERPEQP